jgi:DNA-binding NtrC family response regulator
VPTSCESPAAPKRQQEEQVCSPVLHLLVVERPDPYEESLGALLELSGRFRVETVHSAGAALRHLLRHVPDAILAAPGEVGAGEGEFLRRARETAPGLPVLLLSDEDGPQPLYPEVEPGPVIRLRSPLDPATVVDLLWRTLGNGAVPELEAPPLPLAEATVGEVVFGDHAALESVRAFARQVARTGTRVLITGESGTGKSLLARRIHELSGAPGRFVEINCAAMPGQLLESELFGHEKGAFTDARTMKRGLFEAADRGTLLLDDIGTLPLELQAKLLQILERREVRRVGGLRPIPVRTRVIATSNDDLRARVRDGLFRQDLYFRLDVAAVEMPPLRLMTDTIPALAAHLTARICHEMERPAPTLSERSFARLETYAWPGNTRELGNAIERALVFHAGGEFIVEPPRAGFENRVSGDALTIELGLTLEEVERRYICAALDSTPGDLEMVAARLGISRKTLWEKRRRYRLQT